MRLPLFKSIVTFLILTASGQALSCRSDFDCDYGSTCVKKQFSSDGFCAKEVNSYGNPTYKSPSLDSVGPRMDSGCSFNSECPIGFKCINNSCVKSQQLYETNPYDYKPNHNNDFSRSIDRFGDSMSGASPEGIKNVMIVMSAITLVAGLAAPEYTTEEDYVCTSDYSDCNWVEKKSPNAGKPALIILGALGLGVFIAL